MQIDLKAGAVSSFIYLLDKNSYTGLHAFELLNQNTNLEQNVRRRRFQKIVRFKRILYNFAQFANYRLVISCHSYAFDVGASDGYCGAFLS